MQQQTPFLEMYRATLRTTADMMKTALETTERMQHQQLDGLKRALEDNTRTTRELSEAKSIDEMFTVQSRLTGAQLERTVDFWSRLWRMAADTQMTALNQWQSQMGQFGERVRDTYAFTARTTEDATRFAASQTASSTAVVRDSMAQAAQEQQRKQESQQRKSA